MPSGNFASTERGLTEVLESFDGFPLRQCCEMRSALGWWDRLPAWRLRTGRMPVATGSSSFTVITFRESLYPRLKIAGGDVYRLSHDLMTEFPDP